MCAECGCIGFGTSSYMTLGEEIVVIAVPTPPPSPAYRAARTEPS